MKLAIGQDAVVPASGHRRRLPVPGQQRSVRA